MLSEIIDDVSNAFDKLLEDSDDDTQTKPKAVPANSAKEVVLEGETYKLKAFLFAGSDPVANFIKTIELHEVVPKIDRPFRELWTHAGILVDKSVLPLDCLEEGKLYIYESVFSGEVAGYEYSKVLPVDHPTEVGDCHLGPQLRDFEAAINDGDANVGICPLGKKERAFLEARLKEEPKLLLNIYNRFKDFGYPITNILPVIASASTSLYEELQDWEKLSAELFPDEQEKKSVIFCSELVSVIYKEFGLASFKSASPDTFCPLEVELVPEFGSTIYYAKENKVLRLKNGNTVSSNPVVTRSEALINSFRFQKNWIDIPPGGGVPASKLVQKAGHDIDGVELYIARVKIGSSYRLGKIRATDKVPFVNYFGHEIQIHYGHEVLASLEGTEWVTAQGGEVPEHAVEAGVSEDGTLFYIARAPVGEEEFLDFESHKGGYACGGVARNLKGARVPFAGEEVKAHHYQVLCHKN
ncbi:hypothetical protein BDR26DRAFT_945732 [Obelidium mucronatum]|nr:hypothetical protein BDR26DRAFT_945732 [Obelidium mucronatum]